MGAVAARAVLDQPVRLPDDHGRRYRADGRETVVLLHPANASRHRGRVADVPGLGARRSFGGLAARAGFPVVEVTAGIVERAGRFLGHAEEPGESTSAGCGSFRREKREPGESLEACLARELDEELGMVRPGRCPLSRSSLGAIPTGGCSSTSSAVDRTGGRIVPREGQPYRWVTPLELRALPMPPADAEVVVSLAGDPAVRRSRPRRQGTISRSGWRRRKYHAHHQRGEETRTRIAGHVSA